MTMTTGLVVLAAVAAGHRSFQGLALASPDAATPCGACRQVLAEFCTDLPIILFNVSGSEPLQRRTTLAQLLPDRFEL